jgi:hypothetical protein
MKDPMKEVEEELRGFIQGEVVAGFDLPEDILDAAIEVVVSPEDADRMRPRAQALLTAAIADQAEREASWPEVTDCDRLDRAFDQLEREGIVARQHFSCCGTCGVAEIHQEITDATERNLPIRGYAFYHVQDTESAVEGHGIYLNYGACKEGHDAAVAIGHEVAKTLESHGLRVEWSGSLDQRIGVPMDWKRRRSPKRSQPAS